MLLLIVIVIMCVNWPWNISRPLPSLTMQWCMNKHEYAETGNALILYFGKHVLTGWLNLHKGENWSKFGSRHIKTTNANLSHVMLKQN